MSAVTKGQVHTAGGLHHSAAGAHGPGRQHRCCSDLSSPHGGVTALLTVDCCGADSVFFATVTNSGSNDDRVNNYPDYCPRKMLLIFDLNKTSQTSLYLTPTEELQEAECQREEGGDFSPLTVRAQIPFTACMAALSEPEVLTDFWSSAVQAKTTATKYQEHTEIEEEKKLKKKKMKVLT